MVQKNLTEQYFACRGSRLKHQYFHCTSVIKCHLTACIHNSTYVQCETQNCQLGLLQHAVGGPQRVVGDPLHAVTCM